MLSTDLAELYKVEPRVLVQAVKRNIERFPDDFMFQLNKKEFSDLKSQIVTSRWGGLRRATPYAFTEQGKEIGHRKTLMIMIKLAQIIKIILNLRTKEVLLGCVKKISSDIVILRTYDTFKAKTSQNRLP